MRPTRDETLGMVIAGLGLLALLLLLPGGSGEPGLLRVALGWGAVVIVPAAVLGGVLIVFARRFGWQVRWAAIAGLELLFLAVLALSHTGRSLEAARAGAGGGVVGWAIGLFASSVGGVTGARILLTLLALAGLGLLWVTLPPGWTRPIGQFVDALRPAAALRRPVAAVAGLWQRLRSGVSGLFAGRAATPDDGPPVTARPRSPRRKPAPAAEPPPARPASRGRGGRPPRPTARPAWLPSYDLLAADAPASAASSADARQRAQLLKQTLAEFGVPVEVVSIKEGPTVTQFGLEPGEIVRELRNGEIVRRRVPVSSILRLNNDLALALAAASLRIEAPVPGQPYVGIEAPNPVKSLVNLRSILESREFIRLNAPLAMALGRDVAGDPVVIDLARLPHLLIAGATGSGKSVCINALICSLLMSNGPESVQLLMIDPKMVELPAYNGIPHLLGSVITDPAEASAALAWLLAQMDERYRLFAEHGARNIGEYNRKFARGKDRKPLPYLVLVIDELADLMMTAAEDIERQICRLAQMARATGIHLVLATQRPSVDVITGLIKANFPSRIAFAVTSQIDSRVILDTTGAEKLLGRGDMLYMAPDAARNQRIQGCYISDREIDALTAFWRAAAQPATEDDPAVEAAVQSLLAPWAGHLEGKAGRQDELMDQALKLLANKRYISTSVLQRQLRIGFPRAARLMDQLEEAGYVASGEGGSRSREVLYQGDEPTADDETAM
ncbi:MAG: DNA translocase SpoIIIE [Chloroflexi bacterium ADurb.Bin325]|nr:MAG: DNA translocase SpoIIIE [Chloroflexi bacterium ADurb.Bin325]